VELSHVPGPTPQLRCASVTHSHQASPSRDRRNPRSVAEPEHASIVPSLRRAAQGSFVGGARIVGAYIEHRNMSHRNNIQRSTDERRSRSPLKDRPLRNPGQSVEEQRRKLIEDKLEQPLLVAVFVVVLAGYEWCGTTPASRRTRSCSQRSQRSRWASLPGGWRAPTAHDLHDRRRDRNRCRGSLHAISDSTPGVGVPAPVRRTARHCSASSRQRTMMASLPSELTRRIALGSSRRG
jgi:hypothetical protein